MTTICHTLVFHFNKKHLEDATVPMWTLKHSGHTLYVKDVTANVAWSTKQTPNNRHTKGSIKFRNVCLQIDDDNHATITTATAQQLQEYKAQRKKEVCRILVTLGWLPVFEKFVRNQEIRLNRTVNIPGSCGRGYTLVELPNRATATQLALGVPETFRMLMENEVYYKAFDDQELMRKLRMDEYLDDEDEYLDEDEDLDPTP